MLCPSRLACGEHLRMRTCRRRREGIVQGILKAALTVAPGLEAAGSAAGPLTFANQRCRIRAVSDRFRDLRAADLL